MLTRFQSPATANPSASRATPSMEPVAYLPVYSLSIWISYPSLDGARG